MKRPTNLLAKFPGRVTSTDMEPPANLDYEEWRMILHRVRELNTASQWWYGALCLYGEAHYGEAAAQAMSETGFSEDTIQRYRHVAERIDARIRIRTLSWSHHREVAYTKGITDIDQRREWLEKAEREGWNVRELREQLGIAGLRGQAPKSESPAELTGPDVDQAVAEMAQHLDNSGNGVAAPEVEISQASEPQPNPPCACCERRASEFTVDVCGECFDRIMADGNATAKHHG